MASKAAFLLLAALLSSAFACKCINPTLHRTYYATDVANYVKTTVISSNTDQELGLIKYILSVDKNFKGCAPGKKVEVYTPESSAACGVSLDVGTQYVLPLREEKMRMIFLCDFIEEYKRLSEKDRDFLEGRFVCCKDVCKCASGESPFNCLVNPCDPPTVPPCADATECIPNYCGGCFAEWFNDKDLPACE